MSYDCGLTVLIADDSDSDRLLLQRIVQNQGHRTIVAKHGLEAIEAFKFTPPDIVLLDALMPVMDGFDTARYIKAHMGTSFIPIIFLTSLNDAESLARCLEAGGDDFLTKPYQSVVLRAKINAFTRMMDMHNTLLSQKEQISENNQRLLREQEVAKQTFDKIAHEGMLHASNIQFSLSPMAVFNGDVLLAGLRPNGHLCLFLGDFTGHGLAAAVGAMPLSETFYSMIAKGFNIKDITAELNKKLKDILPVGVFCCAIAVDMDFYNGTIEVFNAGMPDCCIYRSRTGQVTRIASDHLPLGILPTGNFKAKTHLELMEVNDTFYMWSDGIIEAENEHGEMFGEDSVYQVFEHRVDKASYFNPLLSAVGKFIGGAAFSDDVSLVEVRMLSQGDFDAANGKKLPLAPLAAMDWCFTYEIRRKSLRDADPMPVLQKILLEVPSLRYKIAAIFTVITELYANALEHGLLQLSSEIKQEPDGFVKFYRLKEQRLANIQEGFIRFDLDYYSDGQKGRLLVRITDSGQGFDHKTYQVDAVPDENTYRGRGLMITHGLCDILRFQGSGNIVEVEFQE